MDKKRSDRWFDRLRPFGSLVCVMALSACGPKIVDQGFDAQAEQTAPSIVLIVTDDQRWDTLWAMPHVLKSVAGHGMTFKNAFVVNPVCCPSRATLLTGQYSHTTGVYTNHAQMPFGGFPSFHDGETIATVLQSAGYRTGLFGKYLAGYHSSYVPPGWDRWFATYGHGGYYQYHATDDGVVVDYGNKRADYGTKVLADVTTQFIETSDAEEPLFAYVAPHAPHKPATPAPGDGHAFSALKAWRPPSYNEPDVSDKPPWLRSMPRLSDDDRAAIDAFRADQYRSLLGVDRLVRRIVTALKDSGRLSTTLLVFTSDNGMLWGEHRLDGKGAPYEESIRVPILVRYDPLIAMPGATDHHLVLNLDLAPTFAELAGVELPNVEGRSLLSLLEGSGSGWRSHFLVEHLGDLPHGVPTFCAVRERRWVFVRYDSGRSEIYNLTHDPFELRNRIPAMKGSRTMIRLKRQLKELCDPAPPGYSIGSP